MTHAEGYPVTVTVRQFTADELTVIVEALREYNLRLGSYSDRRAAIQTALLKCMAQLTKGTTGRGTTD